MSIFTQKTNYFESPPVGDERFYEQITEIKGIIDIHIFWTTDVVSCNNESKKGGKDLESIQSSTKSDQGYHIGK